MHPSPAQLKILGHPLRLAILRRLMHEAATLTQLGAQFAQSPAHIRHHVKALEQAGLVVLTEPPPQHTHLEKYYRATSSGWLVQLPVLPATETSHPTLVLGSKDAATQQMAAHFAAHDAGLTLHLLAANSLDGLALLRQGVCQMTTCHLREPNADTYNRAYVQHWFPGEEMVLLRLFARTEGLIMAAGNPKHIVSLADLARPDVTLINRERGAGIRVWLDQALTALGIVPQTVRGYDQIAPSHDAVARAVQMGTADVGIGIAASAQSAGLGFMPLFEEPYDLVLPVAVLHAPGYAPLFDYLASRQFRTNTSRLPGYLLSPTAPETVFVH